MVGEKKITLCVCTYNKYKYLLRCLKSIADQEVPFDLYNVIILDNTPSPCGDLYEKCKSFSKTLPNLKYINKLTDGLSGARNECLGICTTKIIHYIDDDVLVSKKFVKETIKCFDKHENLSIMGGKVTANWSESPRPQWLSDDALGYLSVLDFGESERNFELHTGMWFAGANIAFDAETLRMFNGFSVKLGRKGSDGGLLGSEEMELVYAMHSSHKLVYSSASVVEHIIQPNRLNQEWFVKRVAWQSISDVMLNLDYLRNPGPWSDNKKCSEYVKENIKFLFSESVTQEEFSIKLRVTKILSFLTSYGLKTY